MMNHRALVRAHTHWRPRRAAPAAPAERPAAPRRRASRAAWLTAFAALLAGLAIALVLLGTGGSAGRTLPATPRAWLEAFSADVATGSGEVCSRLLSPTFTSELEREAHRSCASYYANAQVLSVRVLRILASGATAAVETATGRAAAIRRSCSTTRPRAGRPSRSCPVDPCLPPEALPHAEAAHATAPGQAAPSRASHQLSIDLRKRANVSEGQRSL